VSVMPEGQLGNDKTVGALAINSGETVTISAARAMQVHRDALLHESYTKQSGFAKDGHAHASSGRFEFIRETVESFRSEAKSAALEKIARYMLQSGRIQSHGVYLLVDGSLENKVIACSTNAEIFFGCHDNSIVGARLSDLFVEGAKVSAALSMPVISLANPVILTPSNRSELEASNSLAGHSPSSSSGTVPSRRRVNVFSHQSEDGLIVVVEEMGDEAVEGAWQVLSCSPPPPPPKCGRYNVQSNFTPFLVP
jgi:hypothetical protein